MKILITGGHVTPALAVIQKLPKDAEVVYVGRKHALEGDSAISFEYQAIQELGIPFIAFHPARLQRSVTKHTIPALQRFPKGIWDATNIIRREKPDVILSFGGYVAFPFAVVAKFFRIPFITHEQTLEAGDTNRFIAKFATKICVSFPSSLAFFPKSKTILTGNPILKHKPSEEIQNLLKNRNKNYPLLAITGGSLGSHAINTFIEPIIEKLLAKYTVIHQTGDAQEFKDFANLSEKKVNLPETFQERYILTKFIAAEDISYVYNASDAVVSRSGANTVLTLLLENTPALLIPLPVSQRQEQLKNALMLKEAGLGEVLLQNSVTSEGLLQAIDMLMEKREIYHNKELESMRMMHESAAEKIIQVIYDTQTHALPTKI